ncbi:MAG: acyl-[ACP]--phospholipid O-acyltransferase [Candidatus Contendobacter odensis]|uniref:Acyl-[ACP]--phospholipid O-acyltransferase n=1 Tax=Candidatus Contendibacter odensensis TaxID=1400860 RepID=A0A2G6PDY4_9GAMM|nr:MAG: acyl-[ACP]--phospholipid O-acyltransferase [Candidatus Contendobacter odensis]
MRYLLQRLIRWILAHLFRVELHGWEHYPYDEQKLLIVANHVSYLDGVLLAAFLPDMPIFVINTHVAQRWWVKPLIAITRHISVDPTSPHYLKTLIQHINTGERIAIFPEGRLSTTGALMKIYEGPALAADKADAALLPIYIDGAQYSLLSRLDTIVRRRWFPRIRLTMLPPRRLHAPAASSRVRRHHLGQQLDRLMTELAYAGIKIDQTLFMGLLEARERHGDKSIILEDMQQQRLNFRDLILRSFILADVLESSCADQNNIGVLLPNAAAIAITLFALHIRGQTPVILNFSAGSRDVANSCKTAEVQTICSSRAFIETADLDGHIKALKAHARIVFLEDLKAQVTLPMRARGWLRSLSPARAFRRMAGEVTCHDPAVILFTSGSEQKPKGVVLTHRNLLANIAQTRAVFDITPQDTVLNVLPLFHAFGLTTATLMPLLLGARTVLYPTPLHFRIIPEIAYEHCATILVGTNTFLMGYGRNANPYDFFSVRLVVMGAEALLEETRQLWADKFGIRINEGYGLTEASPVVACNTNRHHLAGTVGKLFPGIETHLEPIEGIPDGGRLSLRGANIMAGYLLAEQPGVLTPPSTDRGLGWHDTGDIVRIDDDGFVTILGRVKRFAKMGGEIVSLAVVEQLATECWPEEQHVALNQPDPVKGEIIVLLTTRHNTERRELIECVQRQGLSERYIPRQIKTVHGIPLLGSGKPDYSRLRQLMQEQTGCNGE